MENDFCEQFKLEQCIMQLIFYFTCIFKNKCIVFWPVTKYRCNSLALFRTCHCCNHAAQFYFNQRQLKKQRNHTFPSFISSSIYFALVALLSKRGKHKHPTKLAPHFLSMAIIYHCDKRKESYVTAENQIYAGWQEHVAL